MVNYLSASGSERQQQGGRRRGIQNRKVAPGRDQDDVLPKSWIKIAWDEIDKVENANVIFEDIIAITSREKAVIELSLNHRAHHKNWHICCVITHRLLTTGAYSLRKYFPYQVRAGCSSNKFASLNNLLFLQDFHQRSRKRGMLHGCLAQIHQRSR